MAVEVQLAETPIEYSPDKNISTLVAHTFAAANPVIESAIFALKATHIVHINDDGAKSAAQYIHRKMLEEAYSPRTWRTHELHICPPEPYNASNPTTKQTLDWLFLISSLNFSFWSEKDGQDLYGVEWRSGWQSDKRCVWTGYWSLVAALNRALEENLAILDPAFYLSEQRCPDSLIEYIFRPSSQSTEPMPLLKERIAIMREVGSILCTSFGGSFQGFLNKFHELHEQQGTALDLVNLVTQTFPSFQDHVWLGGRKVFIWKRAQILVAEIWAAFYPSAPKLSHPIFPGTRGPVIQDLTMFADYRVPQILHHLRILSYPSSLLQMLRTGKILDPACPEEVSIRVASIVAVEKVREEITKLQGKDMQAHIIEVDSEPVSSVLIDFYLWDLAKEIEAGGKTIAGVDTVEMVPAHRTRSIWY